MAATLRCHYGNSAVGLSKSQVGRLCGEIDEKITAFLNRPWKAIGPILWLDATSVKMRENGRIVSVAVIVAAAVNTNRRREVLGLAIGPLEAETPELVEGLDRLSAQPRPARPARRQAGRVSIMRYADDFVMGFESAGDARRMMVDIKQRLAKFGLSLHEDKTRLIAFGRLPAMARQQRGDRCPETFAFLGFTHYCGWTRDGRFIVKHKRRASA